MSKYTTRARSGSDRTSLYDEITTKIITELEAGRVPWVQPWGTAAAKAPLAMPKNATTGRNYSGINVLILWGSVIEHGFPVQGWLTFRHALSLGGNVPFTRSPCRRRATFPSTSLFCPNRTSDA
jgi:antirestriction protein ArdC